MKKRMFSALLAVALLVISAPILAIPNEDDHSHNHLYEENGATTTPIEILIKLADIYNTSVDYILDLTDNAKPYERKKK